MPLDPERIAETRAWLVKAAEDLRAADFERTAQPPLSSDIVFHAQQTAEKAMKSFLTWHDRPFRKTHKGRSLFSGNVLRQAQHERLMIRFQRSFRSP